MEKGKKTVASWMRYNAWKILFLLPAAGLLLLIVVIPFISGFFYTFTDWNGISSDYNFVFLENYIKVFKDPAVLLPIKNSLLYTAITVVMNNIVGLALAIFINQKFKGTKVFRTIYFLPFVISFVLSGFLWQHMYSDVIAPLFNSTSLLGNVKTVIPAIAGISLWRDSGYVMLIYLAGLQSISPTYYEAARIDGANRWQLFKDITVPNLLPAFMINITLFLGWGIKVFDYVMTSTEGGPGKSSETLAMFVYKYTFTYNRAGYGQTVAIYMMALVFVVCGAATYFFRKKEDEM